MIFRKPYAFLIKYFKVIHAVLTLITFYLIYKSTGIFSFLSDYITNNTSVIGQEITSRLYHPFMYILTVLAIILSLIVLVLMKLKDKPIVLYIFNTIVYIFILVAFVFSKNVLGTMELEIVDIRIIKLLKDVFTAMIAVSFFSLALTFIRATGFDVKKFDFVHDLQELNIEEKDSEEFEVDVEVDTDRYMRKLRRNLRHARYVYVENKFLIHVAIVITLILMVGGLYIVTKDQDKHYKQNNYFTAGIFTMNVTDSYVTKYNYLGNKISDNYTLVIVKLNVRNNLGTVSKLQNAHMELIVDGLSFYPTTKYADISFDLGLNYENYDITSEESTYTIIYEVPNHLIGRKMSYRYINTSGGKSSKVKLNPINLDDKQTIEGTLDKKLTIDTGLLAGSSITLKTPEINDLFQLRYRFCAEDKECYDSIDNIRPIFDHNYDETLMRISLDVNFNKNYTNERIANNNDVISTFGVLKYRLEGDISDRVIRPTIREVSNDFDKTHVYMEINSEVKQAKTIIMEFQIRNQVIVYKIK